MMTCICRAILFMFIFLNSVCSLSFSLDESCDYKTAGGMLQDFKIAIKDNIHDDEFLCRKNSEIRKMIKSEPFEEFECLIVKATECPDSGKESSPEDKEFRRRCRFLLKSVQTDAAFDEMMCLLEKKNGLKDKKLAMLLIKNLAVHGYTKSIPLMKRIAWERRACFEVFWNARWALAIMGREGVDILLDKCLEAEKNGNFVDIGPLKYSGDIRALELARKYLDGPNQVHAICVMGNLGGKLPDKVKASINESSLRSWSYNIDSPFSLYVGCDEMTDEQRVEIRNILIEHLSAENYIACARAARYLRYYPCPEVVHKLTEVLETKAINNDPDYESNVYSLRGEAKKSLEYLRMYYPELWKNLSSNETNDMKSEQ